MSRKRASQPELFMLLTEWISDNVNEGRDLGSIVDAYVSAVGMSSKALVAMVAATRPEPTTDRLIFDMTVELCEMIEARALQTEVTIDEDED
ncbi:MAG: hypothetical protein B7Y80_20440 [Hyphomicrobium sp. 32-62-53]|nr:MAG: hypothetical protein B7Z29_20375 [Hyphomicrobium sp. 12-62-95]OYX97227.1 MAG: hypothetical protein B7Y80_20440 [Hyphomicrobium sp. 32-62-53]